MIYLPTAPSLAKLPYATDTLQPFISGESLCFIQQKILPNHLSTLNTLIHQYSQQQENKPTVIDTAAYLSALTHEQLTAADDTARLIHRYTSEIYNHAFYFASMRANGGGQPPSDFYAKILSDFGSFEKFSAELIKAATCPESLDRRWLWLVATADNKLSIFGESISATRAHPLANNLKPLAVINLHAHAYYLDYRERKGDYVQTFLDKLINYQHIASAFYNPKAWDWA